VRFIPLRREKAAAKATKDKTGSSLRWKKKRHGAAIRYTAEAGEVKGTSKKQTGVRGGKPSKEERERMRRESDHRASKRKGVELCPARRGATLETAFEKVGSHPTR